MNNNNSYIAVLPARGGSKRLPGKNLLEIAGKPLIAWTIESALQSTCFSHVMVNTDDPNIAGIAQEYGAEVPFLRPAELAEDKTTTVEVLLDMLDKLEALNIRATHLVLLQPTSPLRTAKDIQAGIALLEQKNADAIVSVCKTEHSPLWSNILPKNQSLADFIPESIQKTPSQKLPQYYRLNGAMYICEINRLKEEGTLFLSSNCYAYTMSRKNSIDIDDQVDFDLADIYLRRSKASM